MASFKSDIQGVACFVVRVSTISLPGAAEIFWWNSKMTLEVVAHTLATPQVQSLPAAGSGTVGVLLCQWTSHLYAAAAHAASDLLHFTPFWNELEIFHKSSKYITSCMQCLYLHMHCHRHTHQTYSWSEPPCVAVIWRKKACLENHVTSVLHPCITTTQPKKYLPWPKKSFRLLTQISTVLCYEWYKWAFSTNRRRYSVCFVCLLYVILRLAFGGAAAGLR